MEAAYFYYAGKLLIFMNLVRTEVKRAFADS